ncbi:PREDICTED: UPF0481 protein At3g47200-like [Tarenaya hassleriana]|uniref:UPF0481 protein At3g47200-like n=1 Tax=Tarenaya hassleriana TaxID=28532 RepID=UPI0008FD4AB3|nr:PREDICTED: UPF0481 protein At3g47200-like [Tarenaya hassleriana]
MDQLQVIVESPGDALVDAIKEKLESLSSLSSKCCIYRVPERLRRLNPEAYSPRVVSIGPLHHGKEELQAMEEHKLRYMQSFIYRTSLSIEELVQVVRTWEEKARDCYTETLELSSDDFVKMLIVDGSFVVEFILRCRYPNLTGENDRIVKRPSMTSDVFRDMILLENQLPGFVVKDTFGLLSDHYLEQIQPFPESIQHHFRGLLPNICTSEADHFVDLLRCSCLPSIPRISERHKMNLYSAPSATELNAAGVRLELEKNNMSSLDIKFANGVLTIPPIIVDDFTETMYRNIIAFEQCHCWDKHFSEYAGLLSCFMQSSTDVELLVHRGILRNNIGNGQNVSKMFENITKEILIGGTYYYETLSDNLQAYCRSPWNKWKATLRRDYFRNPWSIASVLAAITLLLLTLIQVVCSILAL